MAGYERAIRFRYRSLCFLYTDHMGASEAVSGIFIQIFNNEPELISRGIPLSIFTFSGYCFMALQFTAQCTFCGSWKSQKSNLFLYFPKGTDRSSPLLSCCPGSGIWAWTGILGKTHLQPDRRLCKLFYHASHRNVGA